MICRVLKRTTAPGQTHPPPSLRGEEGIFGEPTCSSSPRLPESAWQTPFARFRAPVVRPGTARPRNASCSISQRGRGEQASLRADYPHDAGSPPLRPTDYGFMHKRRTLWLGGGCGYGRFSASILMPGGVGPVDRYGKWGTRRLPLRLDDLRPLHRRNRQITAWTTTALHVRGAFWTRSCSHAGRGRLWLPSSRGGGGGLYRQFATGTIGPPACSPPMGRAGSSIPPAPPRVARRTPA